MQRTSYLPAALLLVLSACGLAACGGTEREQTESKSEPPQQPAEREQAPQAPKVRLRQVGEFDSPLHVAAVPGTDLLAVVEKGGRVIAASGMACAGADRCPRRPVSSGRVLVDLSDEVSTGTEQGLLGLAFHPDWPDDPRLFLNYTDRAGDTRIEAWDLRVPTGRARRQRELLRIEQPYANHNGGHLAFGPDGLLYIGTGDGGAGGDPEDRAQDPDELLGKLLRVDVDAGGERGYAPAPGNLREGAPEVWALGLRNPWRFSFDRERGDLWIGDVGQSDEEEIDALDEGSLDSAPVSNFGWRRYEGWRPFEQDGRTGPGRLHRPALTYGRRHGCSVTGGVVYRGRDVPELRGWYLFADFCEDDLRLLHADGVPGEQHRPGDLEWVGRRGVSGTASFGETARGEVLVVSLEGGIHQVMGA